MSKPKSKKKILLIDDDLATLKLFSTALSNYGYKVIEARCGDEGLIMLKGNEVDLVVTDWKMPNMNGLSLLHEMRAEQRTRHIPVLIVSAYDRSTVLDKVHPLEASLWLQKPFKLNKMVEIVETLLIEN